MIFNLLILLIVVFSHGLNSEPAPQKSYIDTPTEEKEKYGAFRVPYVLTDEEGNNSVLKLMNELKEIQTDVFKTNIFNDLDPFLEMDAAYSNSKAVNFKEFFLGYSPPKHTAESKDSVGFIMNIIAKISEKKEWKWVKQNFYFGAVHEGLSLDEVEDIRDMPCKLDDPKTVFAKRKQIDSLFGLIYIEQNFVNGTTLKRKVRSVIIIDMDRNTVTAHSLNGPDLKESFRFGTNQIPQDLKEYNRKVALAKLVPGKGSGNETRVPPIQNYPLVANRITRKTISECYVQLNRYQNDKETKEDKLDSTDLIFLPRPVVTFEEVTKWLLLKSPVRMMLRIDSLNFEVSHRKIVPRGLLGGFVFVRMYKCLQPDLEDVFTIGYNHWKEVENGQLKMMYRSATIPSIDGEFTNRTMFALKVVAEMLKIKYPDFQEKLRKMEKLIKNYKNIFQETNWRAVEDSDKIFGNPLPTYGSKYAALIQKLKETENLVTSYRDSIEEANRNILVDHVNKRYKRMIGDTSTDSSHFPVKPHLAWMLQFKDIPVTTKVTSLSMDPAITISS